MYAQNAQEEPAQQTEDPDATLEDPPYPSEFGQDIEAHINQAAAEDEERKERTFSDFVDQEQEDE